MRVRLRDDVQLEARVAGSGPAIVCHPGFSETADYWDGVVRRLADSYTVVTFDPRGHGRSDKPWSGYSIAGFARDLEDLLIHFDLQDVVVVGHSVGGAVALAALDSPAAAARIGGLVLSSPAVPGLVARHGRPGMPAEAHAELVAGIANAWPDVVADLRGMLYHRHGPDSPAALWLSSIQLQFPSSLAAQLMTSIGAIDIAEEQLRAVSVPVQLLAAKEDKVTAFAAAEWLRDHAPADWQFTAFDGAGHCSMVDVPEAYADALRAFAVKRTTSR